MSHGPKPKSVITIDGPGGSGKDTLAENLVESGVFGDANVKVFNSGNFSRSIALAMITQKIDVTDPSFKEMAIKAMDAIDFSQSPPELYTTEVETVIPAVAVIPEIRSGFAKKLPGIIESFDADILIILGRVIGSLYPQAIAKLYLETSQDTCNHRRAHQRSLQGEDYETVLANQEKRNKADASTWNADNQRPENTVVIHTDHQTPQDVLKHAVAGLKHIF